MTSRPVKPFGNNTGQWQDNPNNQHISGNLTIGLLTDLLEKRPSILERQYLMKSHSNTPTKAPNLAY